MKNPELEQTITESLAWLEEVPAIFVDELLMFQEATKALTTNSQVE